MFLVATCNEMTSLVPEFLRKGRFDEIFFVDLPTAPERDAILRIQLSRRKRDPAAFDLGALDQASDGFSGAELEAAVVSALYRAFAAGAELTTEAVAVELSATAPISRTGAEHIGALREWADGRTIPAGREDR